MTFTVFLHPNTASSNVRFTLITLSLPFLALDDERPDPKLNPPNPPPNISPNISEKSKSEKSNPDAPAPLFSNAA